MKFHIEITADGDVTLPAELLQHLGVDPGGQIEVTELPDGHIELRAPKRPGPMDDLFRFAYGLR